jgi:L-Ala-D/L-Glu epimerase
VKITAIDTIPIRVGVDRRVEVTDAKGFRFSSNLLVVIVRTDEGLDGIGEANGSSDWSGETHVASKHLIDHHMAPQLVGEDPRNVTHCISKIARIHANPFAKAAIEMALYDVLGKSLGVPLYRLLGGAVRSTTIPLRFPLMPVEPAQAARVARSVVAEGCRTVKVKVGRDSLAADLELVGVVRDAVGPEVRVTVDANGGWTANEAVRMAPQLADLGVAFIEQPVARFDLDALAWVRARSPLPIMADESVFTLYDALTCLRKGAADVISVYPGKNGGIATVVAIASAAQALGVHCAIGSNLEWDIASAAMIHLAVALPNIQVERYAADIIGQNFHTQHALQRPLEGNVGQVSLPAGPGLGIELDMDALEPLRI